MTTQTVPQTVFEQFAQHNAVSRPERDHHRLLPMWTEEQIWGHRIYPQSPWLVFLEFLTVAEACDRNDQLLQVPTQANDFYPLTFYPHKRMHLRNILWNNEGIQRLAREVADNDTAWEMWLASIKERAQGVSSRDFGYLRTRFESFHRFASLVDMLLDSAVESQDNKRWTSRFVFPFGPNAIYEDIAITATGGFERQYINFGRTGELLYMMLCRSQSATLLRPHMARMLGGDNPWNSLLGLLQPEIPDPEDLSSRGRSYLPYKTHLCFDDLGRDWLALFDLGLPGFDGIEHLVTLGALHIMLYQMRVAAQWNALQDGEERKISFICEVVAPKKTFVREQSVLNYQENAVLTTKAVSTYIDQIEKSEAWRQAVHESASTDEIIMRCRHILGPEVWWGDKDDYDGRDPAAMMQELREAAARRHRAQAAEIHHRYSRDIGLVSRKGTTKFRYAPNDPLLRTLLFANVSRRMELQEFLHQLFERYGLVFGPREAERVLPAQDFDPKPFAANAARLEQRLGSLGLLRRLSDGCAYVVNPHA